MLKVLLALVLTLAALDLAVLGARMAAAPISDARIAALERQVFAQRTWIQQREAMASGHYSYYDPRSLGELEGAETRAHGLVRSVSPGLGGTPYAHWRP